MKKMYYTREQRRNDNLLHIKARRTRVQLETCKSGDYSFYERASKKYNNKIKNLLKSKDYEMLSLYY